MGNTTTEAKALLFARHFAALPDPRKRLPQHCLLNILFIVLAAQICGAEGWDAMVSFAQAKRPWLETVLDLSAGVPSADTLRRVFAALEPQAVAGCFRSWGGALAGGLAGEVVALDGKALKGAIGTASRTPPLYLLHVWATEQRLLLGQRAVGGAPGESPGAAALLNLLALEGAVVTGDANFCTQRVARAVRAQGGQYVLALKGNRAVSYVAVLDHVVTLLCDPRVPAQQTLAALEHLLQITPTRHRADRHVERKKRSTAHRLRFAKYGKRVLA